jgi:hypothetical protein
VSLSITSKSPATLPHANATIAENKIKLAQRATWCLIIAIPPFLPLVQTDYTLEILCSLLFLPRFLIKKDGIAVRKLLN